MTESTESRVVPGISLDDHPLFAEQPIDQRRLAGIRPSTIATETSTGSPAQRGLVARGQALDDRVEQIADAIAVLGRNLVHRIEPELIELEHTGARPSIVGLVDREQRGLARLANHLGDFLVAGHQAFASIRHEHKEIGVGDRAASAFEHEGMQRILARAEHTSSVCQLEMGAPPLD